MRPVDRLAIRAVIGALALVTLGAPLVAQQPRLRSISRMEAEYPDPFTCVRWGSIRELSDGRLVVADPTEKRLEIIDFRRETGTKIGREGSGPGEWGLPMALVPLPGDTTLLYDPQNGRLQKILANGTMLEEGVSLGTGGGGMTITLPPRGYDRLGRLYFQSPGFTIRPGTPMVPSDSAPITRFDPRTSKTDTIGYIGTLRPQVQTSNQGGRQMNMVMFGGSNPFAPQPTWAVLPDGRVGIVGPEPYRVEWIASTGIRSSGPPVTYERLRVTEADKNPPRSGPSCSFTITRDVGGAAGEVRARATAMAAVGARAGGAGGAPRDDWPEFKPPFVTSGGQSPAVATPTGELWVLRTRAANDEIPTYDVFDATGRMVSRVALPKGARLLGFGNGTIYLSRMDADDLVYIQRWRLDTP